MINKTSPPAVVPARSLELFRFSGSQMGLDLTLRISFAREAEVMPECDRREVEHYLERVASGTWHSSQPCWAMRRIPAEWFQVSELRELLQGWLAGRIPSDETTHTIEARLLAPKATDGGR